ncbi:unnamed protein product [Kluyveromyces dobzhanskii CBS 2104]|uniref:WGS project CCBQ000000000 data, contig 00011 n=1 Tax=Kluyveromyces dobzhanskii CBS 2104 TaxID=1427455 RepID=A0A0A8LA20_9SACH|nr:unnamed protein product [Kluyveromyces dobzhanskii CBS 2104]
MTVSGDSLVLIHPAVTQQPELLESVKKGHVLAQTAITNQYLVNKLNDGSISLDDERYDVIYYVTPEKATDIQFPSKLIPVLHRSLKPSGKLYGLSDNLKVDALINGFEILSNKDSEYYWIKKTEEKKAPVSISLKSHSKSGSAAPAGLPSFKKLNKSAKPEAAEPVEGLKNLPTFKKLTGKVSAVKLTDSDLEDNEDDELESDDSANNSKTKFFDNFDDPETGDSIDEDDLITETEENITMIECGKSKQRRRKACKDCTCGLKEMEEQEVDSIRAKQQQVVKFSEEELTEIDFTIEGKKVGGCGSCALGDAFRCSGCPYLGLPAFKPGQPINLNSISDDL